MTKWEDCGEDEAQTCMSSRLQQLPHSPPDLVEKRKLKVVRLVKTRFLGTIALQTPECLLHSVGNDVIVLFRHISTANSSFFSKYIFFCIHNFGEMV